MALYNKILVTVDQLGNQLTRDRVREFIQLTGSEAYLAYIAPARTMTGEVMGSGTKAGLTGGEDVAIGEEHIRALQEYVDILAGVGVKATGKIVAATEHERGEAIVSLAIDLGVDLVILNFEQGGAKAKAKLASQILARNPRMAVLVARPTT